MVRTIRKTKRVAKENFDPRTVLEDVKSSHILKMGYHEGIMFVLFKNNELYYFNGISLAQYGEIRKAESIGKALHALNIKGIKHDKLI